MEKAVSGEEVFHAGHFVEATVELDRALLDYRQSLESGASIEELQSRLRAVFQFAAESIFLLDELGDKCLSEINIEQIRCQRLCA
jgi:hypothetical protein